jgi:hypothetical protein
MLRVLLFRLVLKQYRREVTDRQFLFAVAAAEAGNLMNNLPRSREGATGFYAYALLMSTGIFTDRAGNLE